MKKIVIVTAVVTVLAGLGVGTFAVQHPDSLRGPANFVEEATKVIVLMPLHWVEGTITMNFECVTIWPDTGVNRCDCWNQPPVCQ